MLEAYVNGRRSYLNHKFKLKIKFFDNKSTRESAKLFLKNGEGIQIKAIEKEKSMLNAAEKTEIWERIGVIT